MLHKIRYVAKGGCKPVLPPGWYPGQDVQGSIPAGWCLKCGSELFAADTDVCQRCIGKEWRKYERKYESVHCV